MRADHEIFKTLRDAGFTLVRHRKHGIWRCPCGRHMVTCQSTPAGGRGNINMITTMRRTLRACKQEETTV